MEAEKRSRVLLLRQAVSDPDPGVCWNAARDLANLGRDAAAALPALSEALKSLDATTALWARYAIAKITGDTTRHLPAIIAALEDKRVFPGMAAFAVAGFGPDAAAAVPILIPLLSHENPDQRWAAAGALAAIGSEAREAVGALIEALRDSDEKVRWYVAWALGEIGPGAAEAVPALIERLDEFDDDVRGYSIRALAKIGEAALPALPKLKDLCEDENPSITAEAQQAIETIFSTQHSGLSTH